MGGANHRNLPRGARLSGQLRTGRANQRTAWLPGRPLGGGGRRGAGSCGNLEAEGRGSDGARKLGKLQLGSGCARAGIGLSGRCREPWTSRTIPGARPARRRSRGPRNPRRYLGKKPYAHPQALSPSEAEGKDRMRCRVQERKYYFRNS